MTAPMPALEDAWRFLEESDLVANAVEIEAAIARVAAEIHGALAQAYPVVLVVMGGAVVFAGRLLPLLRFPLDLDYVHVSRYGAATQGGALTWKVAPPESVRARAVLVLDDVLDGGHTLHAIRERVLSLGAASCHCAVLVDKQRAQPRPITADFVGLRVPDRFVFGCGMDARGLWRNLPEIRAMRGE